MRATFYFQLLLLSLFLFYVGNMIREKIYYMTYDDLCKYLRIIVVPVLKMFLFTTVVFGLLGVIYFQFITASIPAAIFISSIALYKVERKDEKHVEIAMEYHHRNMCDVQKHLFKNSNVFMAFMIFSFIIGVGSIL